MEARNIMLNQPAEISLKVPAEREYALVIRTALGGVSVLKNLDVDAMDDLRTAADEAFDCLMHQSRKARTVEMQVYDSATHLTVVFQADLDPDAAQDCPDITEISRAVLETLVAQADLSLCSCGCVSKITLTLPKAVAQLA